MGDRAADGGAGCRHGRARVGLRLRGDLGQGQPQSAGRVRRAAPQGQPSLSVEPRAGEAKSQRAA